MTVLTAWNGPLVAWAARCTVAILIGLGEGHSLHEHAVVKLASICRRAVRREEFHGICCRGGHW